MSSLYDLYKKYDTEDYLNAAVRVADFIRKNEVVTENGKHWQIGTLTDKEADLVESSFLGERSLYAGAAGIALFFIQLYDVTKNESYLDEAKEAARYLTSTYDPARNSNPGLHSGTAGEGYFLYVLYEKTGDEAYKAQAVRIADDIYKAAKRDDGSIHWDGYFDLMGDAGALILWFLLYEKLGDEKYLSYSKEVLDDVLKLGVDYDDGARYWKLFDPSVYFGSLPKGGVVPNFAHGTGGVVYLLARYYELTKDERYLAEAKKGYEFLKKIAINDGDSSIVPYLFFEESREPYGVYYLGYCHGPAGDGITLRKLYQVTGDEEYLDFFKRLSNALIKAGVPGKRSAGYWNDCLCCGSASVLYHFLSGSDIDEDYLAIAKETADKSISDAYKDEDGYRWYNAWTRIKPWDVDAHLGLYVGAAGSASALLALYAKDKNIRTTQLFEYAD